ncbi:universal stress protein [Thalassobacillus sp. B23F22_16]|mgnify:CR=1 FL=1|uniref:universal stress protein n=1 Tax=Thalassobacillus sp. B23F22_16 TaxID=3459513 RepID=UPI00373E13DC
MVKKYIVPVDGSEHSLRALDYAAKLAGQNGSRILLVNVQPLFDTYNTHRVFTNEEIEAQQEKAANEAIALADEHLKSVPVSVETRKMVGKVAPAICEVADEEEVEGIIMGSRGMGALRGAILGSISYSVLHSAKVPVTIVP